MGLQKLLNNLRAEVSALEKELRVDIPQKIEVARGLGDISENAEFHAINERQARRLADIVQAHLRTDGVVGILGLSYKSGTGVVEESASIHLARQLVSRKGCVVAYDPAVPKDNWPCWIARVDSAAECARRADVLVIAVACPEFAKLTPGDFQGPTTIIDCWGLLEPWESMDIQYLVPGKG